MQSIEIQSQSLIALSVFTSSLLGSTHCLGMCGGIAIVISKDLKSSFFYHIGRMISYVSLGALSGLLGAGVLSTIPSSTAALISPLSLGLVFIYLGTNLVRKKRFHIDLPHILSKPFGNILGQRDKSGLVGAFLIGLLSFSLPCGWLYGFIIGAATTKNSLSGAMMMFMFWLGTIPVLVLSPVIFKKIIDPIKEKIPQVAGLILILAGSFTIGAAIYRFN